MELKVVPEIEHLKEDIDELQVLLNQVSDKINVIFGRDYKLELKVTEIDESH